MPNTYSQIYTQIVFAGKFNWQEGFGAFSYSRSHIDTVIRCILHKEEYLDFLKKYKIKYDEKYLFDWIEWTDRSYGAFVLFLHFFLQTDRPYQGYIVVFY